MDEILDESELPVRYVGYSSCFRREAGSRRQGHPRDLSGPPVRQGGDVQLLRTRTDLDEEHDFMRCVEEEILQELGLPYRAVNIAAGDLGAPAAKKYDLEAWIAHSGALPRGHRLLQLHRLPGAPTQGRAKGDKGGAYLVHTLNGTVVAVGRTIIAIMENYQTADGLIEAPAALRPFFRRERSAGVMNADASVWAGPTILTGANDALIVVDVQRDFCPGGSLGVARGRQSSPSSTGSFPCSAGVYTRDWHPPDHVSFSDEPEYRDGSWPPHAVQGTPGAEWCEGLEMPMNAILVSKGDDPRKRPTAGSRSTASIWPTSSCAAR